MEVPIKSPSSLPIIMINTKKNLAFYQRKCLETFKNNHIIELNAIGQATGMLIKVCESMQRIYKAKMLKLESVGFYDRKQYKKRKLKLIAKMEKEQQIEIEENKNDSL